MKKVIMICMVCMLVVFNTISYGFDLGNVLNGGNGFLSSAITNANASGDVNAGFSGLIKGLSQAGLAIGTIIAIVVGIIIAIKFMSDGANGKAELKESLTPYLIACIVLFAAFGIWRTTVNIMDGTFGTAGGGVPPAPAPVAVPSPSPVVPAGMDSIAAAKVKLDLLPKKDDGSKKWYINDEDKTFRVDDSGLSVNLDREIKSAIIALEQNGYTRISH